MFAVGVREYMIIEDLDVVMNRHALYSVKRFTESDGAPADGLTMHLIARKGTHAGARAEAFYDARKDRGLSEIESKELQVNR